MRSRHRSPLRLPRHIVALSFALLTWWSAAPLAAQPEASSPTSAAQDYARAVQLYNEGRNREALDAFDQAIEKGDEPVYVCNRAVVLMALEEYDRAIGDLEACRDTYDMSLERRATIDAQLQALSVFERVIKRQARELTARLAAPPGEPPQPNSPALDPLPEPAPSASPSASPLRVTSRVTLGLGAGALLGLGAVEFIRAEEVSRYREACVEPSSLTPERLQRCERDQEALRASQRLARGLLVTGAAFGAVGLTTLVLSRPRSETALRLSADLAPRRAALRLEISF